MKKYYRIADLIIEMDCGGRTARQASHYLCAKTSPDIIIDADGLYLQQINKQLDDDECEYLSSGASFYSQLILFDGLMLHSSAVVVDNKAYLFCAPCGVGKSTHTNLWLSLFGEKAYILNDDKPALRFKSDEWYVYGTPWSGKNDISKNEKVPLAGICCLFQSSNNSIRLMDTLGAAKFILEQTTRPKEASKKMRLLYLLDKLISYVPIWEMGCNMDIEAAILSFETMSGKRVCENDEN